VTDPGTGADNRAAAVKHWAVRIARVNCRIGPDERHDRKDLQDLPESTRQVLHFTGLGTVDDTTDAALGEHSRRASDHLGWICACEPLVEGAIVGIAQSGRALGTLLNRRLRSEGCAR
jgi:hypothetical protein